MQPACELSPIDSFDSRKSNIASTKSNVASTLLPFGNNVERNFVLSTKSNLKLNLFKLFQLYRKDEISRKTRLTLLPKRQQCRSNIRLCSIRQVCYDTVADVYGAREGTCRNFLSRAHEIIFSLHVPSRTP